jgi:hypothetical protein
MPYLILLGCSFFALVVGALKFLIYPPAVWGFAFTVNSLWISFNMLALWMPIRAATWNPNKANARQISFGRATFLERETAS